MTGYILSGATPTSPTGAAIGFVDQGWGFFEQKAQEFSARAMYLVNDLPGILQPGRRTGFAGHLRAAHADLR